MTIEGEKDHDDEEEEMRQTSTDIKHCKKGNNNEIAPIRTFEPFRCGECSRK